MDPYHPSVHKWNIRPIYSNAFVSIQYLNIMLLYLEILQNNSSFIPKLFVEISSYQYLFSSIQS